MAPLAAANVRLIGALHGGSPGTRRCVGSEGYEAGGAMSKADHHRHHGANNRRVSRKVDQGSTVTPETPSVVEGAKLVVEIR